MPGCFVCSARLKVAKRRGQGEGHARRRASGPSRSLLSKQQRAFYTSIAPAGTGLGDLRTMGPILVLKLKFSGLGTSTAGSWPSSGPTPTAPASSSCRRRRSSTDAFEVAARTRAYLEQQGIDLSAEQQTKTKTALEFFSRELARAPGLSPRAGPTSGGVPVRDGRRRLGGQHLQESEHDGRQHHEDQGRVPRGMVLRQVADGRDAHHGDAGSGPCTSRAPPRSVPCLQAGAGGAAPDGAEGADQPRARRGARAAPGAEPGDDRDRQGDDQDSPQREPDEGDELVVDRARRRRPSCSRAARPGRWAGAC